MSSLPPSPSKDGSTMPARAHWLGAWLPHPWRAVGLWVIWLMLNQTLAPAHLLLGAVLALVLSRWPRTDMATRASTQGAGADPTRPGPSTSRPGTGARVLTAARLGGIVLYDILVANLQVAWRILGPQAALKPGYLEFALAVRDPMAISLLASIITMTPGTLSAELSDDRTRLRVHALDLDDADEVVAQIRARYESPIRELFE